MVFQPLGHSFKNSHMDSGNVNGERVVFSDQPLPSSPLTGRCGEHPLIVSPKRHGQDLQTWCKGPCYLRQEQDPVSPPEQSFGPHDSVHTGVSDPNIDVSPLPGGVLESLSESPLSPLSKPSCGTTKNAIITLESIYLREQDACNQLQKRSSSPSSPQLQRNTMAHSEAWTERLPNFNFHSIEEQLPLSSTSRDVAVKQENMPTSDPMQLRLFAYSQSTNGLSGDPAGAVPHCNSDAFNQTPIISIPQLPTRYLTGQQQQRYLDHQSVSAFSTTDPPFANDFFPSPHSSDLGSSPSWHPDETLSTSGLPFTSNLHSHDAVAWWSSVPSRFAQVQAPFQPAVLSPTPQRPVQYLSSQNEALEERSIMQFGSFDMSTAVDSLIPSPSLLPTSTAATEQQRQQSPSYYSPQSAHERFPGSPYFSPSQAHHGAHSPAMSTPPRSASIPRTVGTTHRRNRSRKLSMQSCSGPRPAKIAGNEQPGSPNSPGRALTISFVNFTPQDSHKILSGVAPSGSSKTKARREQEARERRRRLGEAALKAVKQAGGDIKALEAALC